jgi:small acid-soluble spore protein (thioredoxin-like protein)
MAERRDFMKPNPDDRRDNVRRIQRNINHTIQNMEAAEEMISKTSDPKLKRALEEKNERRRASLDSLRKEIKDEADFQARNKPQT